MLLAGCDSAEPRVTATPPSPLATAAKDDASPPSRVITANGQRFKRGEVLIKLRTEAAMASEPGAPTRTGEASVDAVLARHGVTAIRPVYPGATGDMARVLHVVSEGDAVALRAELERLQEVEYAEVNLVAQTDAVPDDPYYSSSGSWGQDFRDQWGLHTIRAEEAWEISQGDDVLVAVIDSGLDYEHPDIADNVYRNPGEQGLDDAGRDKASNGIDDDGNGFVDDVFGYDFADRDPDPMDENGHGTHCSGIIAAVTDNGIGIAGVAPRAKILAVKNIDRSGNGDLDAAAAAIVYAAQSGARVINLSQGFDGYSQTLHDAVRHAHAAGAVVVVAAGNSAANVGSWYDEPFDIVRWPAAAREVMTVAAFDHTGAPASFSNFGTKIDVGAPGGGGPDDPNVVAPQRSILSLYSRQTARAFDFPEQVVGEGYYRVSGTSQAAPVVAGIAALLLARNPELSPEQVRQMIRRGARDVGDPGFDLQSGYGLADARAALEQPVPLVAHLTGPVAILEGRSSVEITGSAHGPGFVSYALSWGLGANPTAWHDIVESFEPIEAGALTQWHLGEVAEEDITLRLVATHVSGETYEDRLLVHLDNVSFSEPKADFAPTALVRGGIVSIRGTVMPAFFDHYDIAIRGVRTGELVDPALELVAGGRTPVQGGDLATWDLAGLPPDRYELTLTVTLTTGEVLEESTALVLEPRTHEGTPISLKTPTDFVQRGLTVADIDGDGAAEMLVYADSGFHVLRDDGTDLPGFPFRLAEDELDLQGGMAAGDIDGDGRPEVVGASPGGPLHAFFGDGTLLPGFPVEGPMSGAPVSLADLDGDAILDIVTVGDDGVIVVRGDGRRLDGFAFTPADPALGAAVMTRAEQTSAGDLDGDGRDEVVVMVHRAFAEGELHEVYAFDANGEIRPGWPVDGFSVSLWLAATPALGDLDADGDLEVLVPSGNQIHAFDDDGTPLPGWPRTGAHLVDLGAPVVGDFDGVPGAEVFAGSDVAYDDLDPSIQFDLLSGFVGDGNALPGWPVLNRSDTWAESPGFFGFGMPMVADIDGDGMVELVVHGDTSGTHPFGPLAYHLDGTPVEGWPRPSAGIAGQPTSMPAVADLDGDGLLELAYLATDARSERDGVRQARIYVLDLDARSDGPQPWPMIHGNARRTGHVASASDPGTANGMPPAEPRPDGPIAPSDEIVAAEETSASDESPRTPASSGGGCSVAGRHGAGMPTFFSLVFAFVHLIRRRRLPRKNHR